jgi:hypothetical protein
MIYPIPARHRAKLFWVTFVLQFVPMAIMSSFPLEKPEAPWGIISLELAWDAERAGKILGAWGEDGQRFAILSLQIDFLYILLYSTALSLACVWAGDLLNSRNRPSLAGVGLGLAILQWLAGLFDVAENLSLFQILPDQAVEPWPRVATIFAGVKFFLIAVGLLYVLAAIFPYSPLSEARRPESGTP